MNIRYLKSHNGFEAGDTDDVSEELANYYIRCNVAEYVGSQIDDNEADQPKKRGRKPKS